VVCIAFFLVQLRFVTHRIAFCISFSGGSVVFVFSSIRKKFVLKIERDRNKSE